MFTHVKIERLRSSDDITTSLKSIKMPLGNYNFGNVKNLVVTEVPAGSTAVLNCESNDYAHNFMFWMLDKNTVIGPGNDYDERKYKYEVLSGKLHISSVTPSESGNYKCISRNLDNTDISIGEVEMIVKGSAFSAVDAVKLIAIIVSIVVIVGCAVIYWRLRKEWSKYDGRYIVAGDEADDEDESVVVYNRTTTTIARPQTPQPQPGPSRSQSSDLLYGVDNQGLDTDFHSVFENIQIKSSEHSLI